MSALKMTPARLELLQAVDDGAVFTHYPILPANPYTAWDRGPGWGPRRVRVNGRIAELERAGLAVLGDRVDSHYKALRGWLLTDAGRAILRRSE